MILNTTVRHDDLNLAGISIRTNNTLEAGAEGRIPVMWNQYFQVNWSEQAWVTSPHLLYGVYTHYESDASGEYTFLLGHEHSGDLQNVHAQGGSDVPTEPIEPAELTQIVIPAGNYIVFQTRKGPVYTVIAEVWNEIWAYFQTSETKRTYAADYELYDMRNFDPENAVVNVYIGVE